MNRFHSIFFALLVSSLILAYAADDVLTERDVARFKSLIHSRLGKDGLFGSVADTHYAVASLQFLGEKLPSNVCDKFDNALQKSTSLEEIFHLVGALENSKCQRVRVDKVRRTLEDGLKSSKLQDVYFASQTILQLQINNHASFQDYDTTGVIKSVTDLMEDDGTFRSSMNEDDNSIANAGFAIQILSTLYKSSQNQESENKESVQKVAQVLENLLDELLGTGDANAASSIAKGVQPDLIATYSRVLQGINSLATALEEQEQVALSESHMNRFAHFFLDHKYVSTLENTFHILSALQICANNPIHIPLFVTVLPPSPTSTFPSQIKVTNVLDRSAVKLKVQLKKATLVESPSSPVLENSNLVPVSGSNVLFQLPTKSMGSWKSGFYNLQFLVEPEGDDDRYKRSDKFVKQIKVFVDWKPERIEFSVSDSSKAPASNDKDSIRVNHPAQLSSVVTAVVPKFIHVRLYSSGGNNFQPSQVFAILSKEQSKQIRQAAFVFVPNENHFYLKLETGSVEMSDALSGPGKYSMEVLIGDSSVLRTTIWKVGVLDFPNLSNSSSTSTDVFVNKPDIQHTFRPAEDRPPTIVALLFTVIILLPLVGLLITLLNVRISFSIPTDPQELLSAFVFQGSIAAILLLYVLYWLSLNIFQALAGLGVLSLVAVVSGRTALRALHARNNVQKLKKL